MSKIDYFWVEEYFEKLRVLLKVLSDGNIDSKDRDALIMCAEDCLAQLGNAIGIKTTI